MHFNNHDLPDAAGPTSTFEVPDSILRDKFLKIGCSSKYLVIASREIEKDINLSRIKKGQLDFF